MEPRGALASTASNRSSAARGVHFGEGLMQEGRGVHFGEGAYPDGMAASMGQLAQRAPLSEQLARELDRISPQPSAARRAQIEGALAEVLSACQACIPELAPLQEPGAGDALLSVGSHHLGVATPEDEIDVLFIAPLSSQLQELPAALSAELGRRGETTNLTPAGSDGLLAAPGIRFELRGVQMTVLLAQRIPALPQPRAEAIVQNMAGLFAREASEKIIAGVPNVELFRGLLRFVRHWAKQRGVYGGYLGFPGGTAWAICCSRICQMYPNVELSQLAARFFRTLSRWDWRQPLGLDGGSAGQLPMGPEASGSSGGATAPSTMVVLLPVGSGISATCSVTDTTMKITQKELRRGYKMVQQVELARAHWTDVYKEARFFQRHRHYLEFDFMASSEPIFAAWLAWGRQQIKDLVRLFESMSSSIVTLRPWPEWVEFKDAEWPHARAVFVGLHLERNAEGQQEGQRRSFDLREPIVKFLEAISAWPDAEKYANKFELLIKHVRLSELEQWLENRHQGMVANQGGGSGTAVQGLSGQGGPSASAFPGWAISEEDAQGLSVGLQQCSL